MSLKKSNRPLLSPPISVGSCRHNDHCVLFTGTKGQHAVHYWSLFDNKILRKFRGHSDAVTGMSMSPADDMFLTASKDRSVRLWNVQQAGCVGQMELPTQVEGHPSVVFDSTGMVFAVIAAMAGKQGHVRCLRGSVFQSKDIFPGSPLRA